MMLEAVMRQSGNVVRLRKTSALSRSVALSRHSPEGGVVDVLVVAALLSGLAFTVQHLALALSAG
jgi:hypothetical protein